MKQKNEKPTYYIFTYLTGCILLMALLSFQQLATLDLPTPLGFACGVFISSFVIVWLAGVLMRQRQGEISDQKNIK